jgi:asparagine synthase (glutamine-hydrolysing)
MCGIAGFWDPRGSTAPAVARGWLALATRSLRHRGPDDEGSWCDPAAGVGLGHRRLAIVDLTPGGRQPMSSACGRFQLVLNGEIYNHRELRHTLEGLGHAFRGRSDTEAALAGIVQWGLPGALHRFVGMFALGLWDRRERSLTLARDRMGEKPLYYCWQGGVLLFASELKALRCWPGFRAEVDRDALGLLLRLGYIPAPRSIFEQVSKLPPGTSLTLTERAAAGAARPEPAAYWSLAEVALAGLRQPFAGTAEAATDELEERLRQAVCGQASVDVPLGAFLSGGIDSSTVTALQQAAGGAPVKTFTLGSGSAAYDEAAWARRVAAHLGTDHRELTPTPDELCALVPRLPVLYDEPFADSSALPTVLLARFARREVTVCLAGDGADELFGGYTHHHFVAALWRRLRLVPERWRRVLARRITAGLAAGSAPLLTRLAPHLAGFGLSGAPRDVLYRLSQALLAGGPEELYLSQITEWQQVSRVVRGARELPLASWGAGADDAGPDGVLERMLRLDAALYLPDDILAKVDRATMAVALEVRLPFLDHRIVELAWRLPAHFKVRRQRGKWLVRQLLRRYVPEALVERPKMGFGIPLDDLLRGPLRDWAEHLLDEARLCRQGFFHPAPLRQKWREHLGTAGCNWGGPLWSVLMFQAWYEELAASRADVPQAVEEPLGWTREGLAS